MAAFTSLPIIDVGPLLEKSEDPQLGDHEDVAEVVRQLDHACKEIGFFYVKGHGVHNHLLEGVLSVTREFFQLSHEEKVKIEMSNSAGFRGYQKVGVNVTEGRPDLCEAVDIYKEFDLEAYGALGHDLYGPNLWPKNPVKFRPIMEEYIEACLSLARKILRGIALALGGPPDTFEGKIASDPFWGLRLIGSPPLVNGTHSMEVDYSLSCGAHTDYGLITLVNQDAGVSALQVRNQSGDWILAVPIPGTFVVNIGDMLKILSNGLYQPTLHRVVNNDPKYRVSAPFFLEPNFDARIEPLEICKQKGVSSENFEPVVYGEHTTRKVNNQFSMNLKL